IGTGIGVHELAFNLTAQPAGEDRLLAPGGVSLRVVSPASGDNISAAVAEGSSGAILTVGSNKASLTMTPVVRAEINAASIELGTPLSDVGGNLTLTSDSKINATANGDNGSGGVVAVGLADATMDIINASNYAGIGSGSMVNASGAIEINANTEFGTTSTADVDGGGLAAVSESESILTLGYSNDAVVGNSAELTSGNKIVLASDTKLDATSKAYALAGGAGAGADAVGEIDLSNASYTKTTVGDAAILVGETIDIKALMSQVKTDTVAEAIAGAAFAETDSNAKNQIRDSLDVHIGDNALIQGESVDSSTASLSVQVQAKKLGIDLRTRSDSDTNAIGSADAELTTKYTGDVKVTVDSGATLSGQNISIDSLLDYKEYTEILKDEVSVGKPANNEPNVDLGAEPSIVMNGNLEMAARPAPELFIDENGLIQIAEGVTVGSSKLGRGDNVGSGDIVVNDIVNGDSLGTATLTADVTRDSSVDAEDQVSISGLTPTISGSGGKILTRTTYNSVKI
ncbi:MAG: hypothetical protein NXI32_31025, partial [bacterium]|nr:hypothetical protein [bacterium]